MASYRVHKTDEKGNPVLWSVSIKENGKWVKKYYSEEKEAKRALLGFQLTELESGEVSVPTRGNLAPWILKYKAHKIDSIRQNTKDGWESAFKFLERIGVEKIEDLNTDKLADGLKQESHLSPSSKYSYLMKIRKFIDFLRQRGMNPRVDFKYLKESFPKRFDKEARANKEFLSLEEFQNIADWFAEKKLESRYLLLQILASFGFRINELLKSDIGDLKDGMITVKIDIEKTHTKRFVIFPQMMIDHIHQMRKKYNTTNSDALFICERTGGRLNYRTMAKWWRMACGELKIHNKPIHRLRALGFFVLYESSNKDMLLVREVCGWQSDAFKYYSSSRKDQLPAYFNAIGSMLGNNLICDELNSPISKEVAQLIRNNQKTIDSNEGLDKAFYANISKSSFNADVDRIETFLKLLGKRLVIADIESAVDSQSLSQKHT